MTYITITTTSETALSMAASKQGFIKLVFEDREAVIDHLDPVILGRWHKDCENLSYPFVVVGTSKVLSREHARIQYDAERAAWLITCLGRHGLMHNATKVDAGVTTVLSHQDRIDMSGAIFFVLFPTHSFTQPTSIAFIPPAPAPSAETSTLSSSAGEVAAAPAAAAVPAAVVAVPADLTMPVKAEGGSFAAVDPTAFVTSTDAMTAKLEVDSTGAMSTMTLEPTATNSAMQMANAGLMQDASAEDAMTAFKTE